MFNKLCSEIKRFGKDEQGSVLALVGVAALLLIIATGTAVDMARAQTLQNKISSALDAAGLAAGATANTSSVSAQVTRYFNANFPSNYLGTNGVTLTTTCGDINGNTVSCSGSSISTINLSATATQSTTFMKVVGMNSVNVAATSQITRATSGLELALVLDNTGSMANPVNSSDSSASKIDAVKCALAGDASFGGGTTCENEGLVTTGLLDILYGAGNNSLTDLFVGVVPFSDMVNLNVNSAPGSGFVNNVTSGNKNSMGGCVSSRDYKTTSTTDAGFTMPSGDVAITLDISDDPPSTANSSITYFKGLTSSSASYCPAAYVQPMTTLKSTVVSAIQRMTPNGNTEIQMGFAWGWRMLSPNWLGLWGATPTFTYPNTNPAVTVELPLPYGTAQMQKVVVLMTDGMNTVGSNQSDTAYELQNSTSYPNTVAKLDNLTKAVCDAMKSQGIVIYTIGFGSSSDVDTSLLQYCSSTPSIACSGTGADCFLAPTNAGLAAAFQQIGDVLASLRVSE